MPARRCYPISDVWLKTQDENAPAYVDIVEIRNDPHRNRSNSNFLEQPVDHLSSAYLTWVLANDPRVFTMLDGSTPTRMDHIRAATFECDVGIHVGDIDDGNNIRGVVLDNNIITVGEFDNGVQHDIMYRRIYRDGTTVEKLWFLGL